MGVPAGGLDARPLETSYEKLMSKTFSLATEWLGKHASKSDVVVLAPCGSSRAELLRRLLANTRYFSKAYVYRGFKAKLGHQTREVEEYESIDELAEKLKSRKEGLVVVVPESSFDAVMLKQVLPKARVKLLYLPALYSRAAKELNWRSGDVEKLATVEHAGLGKAYKWRRSAKGYSSTLLRDWKKEELEELKKAKEAILALSPGRLGLGDYVLEFLRKSMLSLATTPIGLLGSYGVPFLLAIVKLLPLAEEETRQILASILGRAGETLTREAEGFVQNIIEKIAKPEARNSVAASIASFVRAAREATPYINREELETIIDQVALEWAIETDAFKAFIENLARMTSDKVATQQDLQELEERIKKKLIEVWSEIEKLKKELEAVQEELKEEHTQVVLRVKALGIDDVEIGGLSAGFKVKKGVPLIEGTGGKARVVTARTFRDSVEEVLSRLEKGFVVLEGPKGAGKSVLATYATWLALLRHRADAVIWIEELKSGERLLISNYLERIKRKRFIIFYDPSPVHAYYEPRAVSTFTRDNIQSLATTLEELIELTRGNNPIYVLAVLPGGAFEAIAREHPELKSRVEEHVLYVNLRDPVFLEQIVKEYAKPKSPMNKDAYQKSLSKIKSLGEEIARFEGGYTLVAKLAGITLRKKGYKVEDAEKLLEEAKGNAKRFIAYYLWSVILKENKGDLARRLAVPLLLHAYFGPIPIGIVYLTKAVNPEGYWRFLKPEEVEGKLPSDLSEKELESVAKWLSMPQEDLVEEMLMEICGVWEESARELYSDLREFVGLLDEALRRIINESVNELKISSEEARRLSVSMLLFFTGRRLAPALKSLEKSSPQCWRRLALIAGSALTAHYPIPNIAAKHGLLPNEALKPCELESYLLVDDMVPPLVIRLALLWPGIFARPLARWYEEATEELKQPEEKRHSKGIRLVERIYRLGLALAVASAAETSEKVEVRKAETALRVACTAVPLIQMEKCVAAILESFRSLGELAPHYYVMLVAMASELEGLDIGATYKLAEVLEEALFKHRKKLRWRAWPLVEAVRVYSNLLTKYIVHFQGEEELSRVIMCRLLEDLEGQLRDIAEVYALIPALKEGLQSCNDADPTSKAERLLRKLEEMKNEKPSKQVTEWIKAQEFRQKEFQQLIENHKALLTHSLALRMLKGDDLKAARELFKNATEIYGRLKDRQNYLANRSWIIRCNVLEAVSLKKLRKRARAFEGLWNETKKNRMLGIGYLKWECVALVGYLIYLVLIGRNSKASKLLESEKWRFCYVPEKEITVKLLLNYFRVKTERLDKREFSETLSCHIENRFRPAFNILMDSLEDMPCLRMFNELKDAVERASARVKWISLAVVAILGDERATALLKQRFRDKLAEESNKVLKDENPKECEVVKRFYSELLDFVEKHDARDLVLLLAPADSYARFTLMLWALVNGEEELARAHAKLETIFSDSKLLRRLFREVAEARSEEELKLALLKLFYYHI
jgi:hypothetical protein